MASHDALQWLALGMALVNKDALAQVLAIDRTQWSMGDQGPARRLRDALVNRVGILRWLDEYGVVPTEGQKLMEAVLDKLRQQAIQRTQSHLAGDLASQAGQMAPEVFREALKALLDQVAGTREVAGKIEPPTKEAV